MAILTGFPPSNSVSPGPRCLDKCYLCDKEMWASYPLLLNFNNYQDDCLRSCFDCYKKDQGRSPHEVHKTLNRWGDYDEIYSIIRNQSTNHWVVQKQLEWFQKGAIQYDVSDTTSLHYKLLKLAGDKEVIRMLADLKTCATFPQRVDCKTESRLTQGSKVRPWTVVMYFKGGGRMFVKLEGFEHLANQRP